MTKQQLKDIVNGIQSDTDKLLREDYEKDVRIDNLTRESRATVQNMKARIEALEAALRLAKEDLEEWHTIYTQELDGSYGFGICEGCATCDETFPAIARALEG